MKRLIVTIFLCIGIVHALPAQDDRITVGNIQVNKVGTLFSIKYDLSMGDDVNWCRIQLYMSRDGGRTFDSKPVSANISGDIDKVYAGGQKEIKYDVASIKKSILGKQLVFMVRVGGKDLKKLKDDTPTNVAVEKEKRMKPEALVYATIKKEKKAESVKTKASGNRFLIEADFAVVPQISYGLMFGMVKKVGWYVKGRSDFNFQSESYECTSEGQTSNGTIWASGSTKKSRLVGTAGVMIRAAKFLYPYAGIGYGTRAVYWEDVNGDWAKVTDYSCSGVSLDAGVLMNFGKFAFSAGVTNTAFDFTEVEIGVGIMF